MTIAPHSMTNVGWNVFKTTTEINSNALAKVDVRQVVPVTTMNVLVWSLIHAMKFNVIMMGYAKTGNVIALRQVKPMIFDYIRSSTVPKCALYNPCFKGV